MHFRLKTLADKKIFRRCFTGKLNINDELFHTNTCMWNNIHVIAYNTAFNLQYIILNVNYLYILIEHVPRYCFAYEINNYILYSGPYFWRLTYEYFYFSEHKTNLLDNIFVFILKYLLKNLCHLTIHNWFTVYKFVQKIYFTGGAGYSFGWITVMKDKVLNKQKIS